MNQKMKYAPEIDGYIEWLGNSKNGFYNGGITYDEKSYKLIDDIFALLNKITPIDENGNRELWLSAERGSIIVFRKHNDWYDADEVPPEEVEKDWLGWYPQEKKWYHLEAVEHSEENRKYQAIFINHRFVLEVNTDRQKGFENKVTSFVKWIYDSVKQAVEKIRLGTYMDSIRDVVPAGYRTGTILQKELWDVDPDYKETLFDGLTDEDISEFLDCMKAQESNETGITRIKDMTANQFFKWCAAGYKAMGYNGCELTPNEQYKAHADGRDEGLTEIDGDSPDAFTEWYTDKKRYGGHPWEVCRGGNSTHIDFRVYRDEEDGYYLSIDGSAYSRTNETIKFFLALHRLGITVSMGAGSFLAERIRGEEKVGVVPQGITPRYCGSHFPDERIICFMNLPYEDTEIYAAKCVWQDLKEVKLLEKGDE